MEIRSARREDVPEINEIVNHQIRTSTSNWSWEERSLEEAYQWFNQHSTEGRYPIYVMEHDSRVVGFGSLSPFRLREGYWPVAEDSIYVHPDYERRGIGRMLMERLIAHAADAGLRVITAWIDTTNVGSIVFHEELGFYHVGQMRDIGEKWGKRCSVTIMQLDLESKNKKNNHDP